MRHGMTNWNYDGRVQGGLDKSRLNQIGIRQARLAGRSLQNICPDSIFCSPLTRAQETLRIASHESGNPAILRKKPEVLHELMEIQVPWQGLHKREIPQSVYSSVYQDYKKNPPRFSYRGFSPIRDIANRARHVWQIVAKYDGSCHLIMGHNQMNKALICSALGLEINLSAWRQENCCFNVVVLEKGKTPKLRLVNGGHRGRHVLGKIENAPLVRMRRGLVRVLLHQVGDSHALRQEVEMLDSALQHIYLIGDVTIADLAQIDSEKLNGTCTHVPCDAQGNTDLCEFAYRMLESLRVKHCDNCIVISVKDSLTLRAFFAVSLGLGPSGVHQLQSDAGGVTIVDLKSSKPVGKCVPHVEAYNVGAWLHPDTLLGYTITGKVEG